MRCILLTALVCLAAMLPGCAGGSASASNGGGRANFNLMNF